MSVRTAPTGVARHLRRRAELLRRRPLVSVVIPCFNYDRYVADAVTSVLTQEGVDVEVIVVDDRSRDASAAVIRALAERDARVRLIEHPVNRGAVETFNTGLAEVSGEFVVRLDADDLLTPGSLARAVAVADAFPSVGLVYGHPLHFHGDHLPPARRTARQWSVWPGREWLHARCATGVNVITSPEVLMRRSVVDRVGGQRALPHTHDMEMWLRIAAVSDVAYINGADQAWHREHAASLSQSVDAGLGDIVDRLEAFRMLFGDAGPRPAGGVELLALAERTLAAEAADRILHMYDRGRVDTEVEARLDAFARSLDDRALTRPALARARRRGTGARPRPWQVARAARRSVANNLRWRRWHRDGVYHRGRTVTRLASDDGRRRP